MLITATEAQNRFGEIMAAKEPVTITKYGRPDKVLIDAKEFEALQAMEDAYWLDEARKGRESGYLGVEESERMLEEYMNAKD